MCPDEKGAKQSIFFIHRAPRAGVEELVSELIWDSQSGNLALFGLQLSLGKLLSIFILFCKFVKTTLNSSLSCHETELSSINDACKMLWTFSNEWDTLWQNAIALCTASSAYWGMFYIEIPEFAASFTFCIPYFSFTGLRNILPLGSEKRTWQNVDCCAAMIRITGKWHFLCSGFLYVPFKI